MSAQQAPTKARSTLKNVLVIGGLFLVLTVLTVGVFARNIALGFMTLHAEDPATHDPSHAPIHAPGLEPSHDPFDAMAEDLEEPAP